MVCPVLSLCCGKPPFPIFSSLSLQSYRQWFALCPLLSVDPRRTAEFSVCSALYLLGQSGSHHSPYILQAPYIQNQKPEVLSVAFESLFFNGLFQ